jgi:hypothetical protein
MKCHSIPGIYLAYTFEMKLCTPPGCRIAIEMQQHTGIGLQECLMFCRVWQCHWASVSQGQAVATGRLGPRRQSLWNRRHRRPLQRRRGRAAAAADADQRPTWAAVVGSRSLRRRPLPRRRGRTVADDDDEAKVLWTRCRVHADDFTFGTVYLRAH